MTTIRVTEAREVKLTPENEMQLIASEYDNRYGDNEYEIGDEVRFIARAKPKVAEFLKGEDYIGKPGIVTQLGRENSVKVLAIGFDGRFYEVWTDGRNVELISE